jgi:sugar-specific transcriptional regulator TrmB
MRLPDLESLESLGLTLYERRALAALMLCGVADAATLCREGRRRRSTRQWRN